MTARKPPALTIVCENYWPEFASTGQLITELAESLAADADIELLTTQPRYNARYEQRPAVESRNGVRIRRLPATSFPKASRLGRLANWLTFLTSVCLAMLLRPAAPVYLFVTNPPTAPWAVAIAALRRRRSFVLVYDLYPDLAEVIGAVKHGSLLARGFDAVNRFTFGRATGLIALGEDMRRRLRSKLGSAARIEVIPNWANGDLIRPRDKACSRFAAAHGLCDRFVFLYAGNLGLFQDLETLIDAVEALPCHASNPVIVFVGNGGKRPAVEARARRSSRVLVFDYVPYEELGDLYAAADVGLISLEPGVENTNVPSKTYSILAAGRPFLAVCDRSTDLAALAADGCGVCVPNDADSVAEAMTALIESPVQRSAMGETARRVFESCFSREAAVRHYQALLFGPEACS